MKLVNIHERMSVVLLLLFGLQNVQAQIWPLDQCIEIAVSNNKKLELGKNKIEIGKERGKQVKANLLPKVKLEADYKYFIDLPTQLMPLSVFNPMIPEGQFKAAQFGVPHNVNANVQFAMPIYNPQIKSNVKNTKIGVELAELQYQKSKEQISFDLTNLYYNAQVVKSQMVFIDDNLSNSLKLQSNIKLIKSQGLAKGTDVDKVALQILQLKSKRNILQNNLDQIKNGMKLIMGVTMEENFEVEANIDPMASMIYEENKVTDVLLVETKNRLLQGELNTLKKSQLPTVLLYGSYGAVGYGYDKSPDQFLDFYEMGFVGVKATYSLFDGNVTKKKKHIKQKEMINNNLQLDLLKDQNAMMIANAKLKIGISDESITMAQSQIEYAQSIYDQTVFQQKNGIASITDILLADSVLRQAQQDYLNATIEYLKADLALKNLTGNILN